MGEQTEARRREATRTFIRYFVLVFFVVAAMSGLLAYAVINSRAQRRESRAIRIEYCRELEKLKTQNRVDVNEDKRNFRRNLRILGVKDTAEVRRIAEAQWAKKLARNAPRKCPYRA